MVKASSTLFPCPSRLNNALRAHHYITFLSALATSLLHDPAFTKFIIDDKLIWKAHITLVKKQVSEASGIICKLRHYIPFRSVKTVYYSIVYSHLRYAITSWGSLSFSTLNTLNIIHNKLLRIMTFSNFNSNVCILYKDTQVLTIDRIFKLEIN